MTMDLSWLADLPATVGAPSYPSPSSTIYVSPSGNDGNPGTISQPVATLQRANELLAGTTNARMALAGGGSWNLSANLTLTGNYKIDQYGLGGRPNIVVGTNSIRLSSTGSAAYLTGMRAVGINFTASVGNTGTAVEMYGSGGVLDDCLVTGGGVFVIGVSAGAKIYNNIIYACSVSGGVNHGVFAMNHVNTQIVNSTFTGFGVGTQTHQSYITTGESVVIDGCLFDGTGGGGWHGMKLDSVDKLAARNCRVVNCPGGIQIGTNNGVGDPAADRFHLDQVRMFNCSSGFWIRRLKRGYVSKAALIHPEGSDTTINVDSEEVFDCVVQFDRVNFNKGFSVKNTALDVGRVKIEVIDPLKSSP